VGLLVIGLWPFAFRPLNRAGWFKDRPGLSFQPDGIVYDPEKTDWSGGGLPDRPAAITIELWLEQGQILPTDVFHILTIDDGKSLSGIVLCQWETALLLRIRDAAAERGFREAGSNGILMERTPRFITLATDSSGTAFYLNGALLKYFPGFTVPDSWLDGRLILGNAAAGKHPWSGDLFGLAIFHRTLDASEVVRHYRLWTGRQAGHLAVEPSLTALYLFDKGAGQWVEDHSTNGHRLFIPERYHVWQKRVLEMPWGPDPLGWSDLDDIVLNILGFMPLGFMVYNYRRLARPSGGTKNMVWAVAAGATLSLAIELIQVWLPNRDSSATDLACNTLGTWLGALAAKRIQSRTARAGQTPDA